MFMRISMVVLAGALMAACQTTYGSQTTTILNVIGDGLNDTEVFTPPFRTYSRSDGAYCEDYQIRQHNSHRRVRYGTATVCRFQDNPWFLAGRTFQPWPTAGNPAPGPAYPAPSPSYPVPNPSHPVPSHPAPSHPTPPAAAPGQPGQWVPVTR